MKSAGIHSLTQSYLLLLLWLIELINLSRCSDRPELLHLNLWGIAAYGTWMASSFLHTSSPHKCFEALLACLPLVPQFSNTP